VAGGRAGQTIAGGDDAVDGGGSASAAARVVKVLFLAVSERAARVGAEGHEASVVVRAFVLHEARDVGGVLGVAQVALQSASSVGGAVARALRSVRVARVVLHRGLVAAVASSCGGTDLRNASIGTLAVGIGSAGVTERNVAHGGAFSSRADQEVHARDRNRAVATNVGSSSAHALHAESAVCTVSASGCASGSDFGASATVFGAVGAGALRSVEAVIADGKVALSAEAFEANVTSLACEGVVASARLLVHFHAVGGGDGAVGTVAIVASAADVASIASGALGASSENGVHAVINALVVAAFANEAVAASGACGTVA